MNSLILLQELQSCRRAHAVVDSGLRAAGLWPKDLPDSQRIEHGNSVSRIDHVAFLRFASHFSRIILNRQPGTLVFYFQVHAYRMS